MGPIPDDQGHSSLIRMQAELHHRPDWVVNPAHRSSELAKMFRAGHCRLSWVWTALAFYFIACAGRDSLFILSYARSVLCFDKTQACVGYSRQAVMCPFGCSHNY